LNLPVRRVAENRIMDAVCDRFGLEHFCPAAVKEADLRILHDERNALMGHPPLPWSSIEQVAPLGVTIRCWSPPQASSEYLMRLGELMEDRA
jgi:hypothetical protein